MFKLIKQLITKYKLQEFIRFVFVGISATAFNYVIYYFLVMFLKVNESIAYTIGYAIAFVYNFFATNLFTFKTKTNVGNFGRFALANVINWSIQMGLLNLFIWLKVPKAYAPLPVYVIAIPVNFIVVRFMLRFKNNQGQIELK